MKDQRRIFHIPGRKKNKVNVWNLSYFWKTVREWERKISLSVPTIESQRLSRIANKNKKSAEKRNAHNVLLANIHSQFRNFFSFSHSFSSVCVYIFFSSNRGYKFSKRSNNNKNKQQKKMLNCGEWCKELWLSCFPTTF
jgi:hypothetical protein